MKSARVIICFFFMLASGCATRMNSATYDSSGSLIKRTVVTHSMAWGVPALFPMSGSITDGDFKVETQAVDLPDFDFNK